MQQQTKAESASQAIEYESDVGRKTTHEMRVEERSTPIGRAIESSGHMDLSMQASLFQIEKQTLSAEEITDMM